MFAPMSRWIALMTLLGGLVLAPPARAGTYDVVSCGAPGAGGVNRSWTGRADDPNTEEVADCGSSLFGGSLVPQRTAPFFTSASWTFTAPAGTTITRLVAWRWGRYFGNGWRVSARQADANIIGGPFGETCTIASGQLGCEFGANTGVSAASRAQYDLNTSQVFYNAACEAGGGCPTSNGATRYAEFRLFGAVVTLRDDTAPALRLSGPLTEPGWRKPGDSQRLGFAATDATGIRRLALTGPSTQGGDRACDFTRPVPCSNATGAFTTRLGDGVHPLTVTATDAGGNATPVTQTVRIDGTPPTARIAVARNRNILVDVGDNVSGVASGQIAVRGSTREPFRDLPTTLAGGRLRARMDRGRAQKSDVRVTVTDVAGNRREGLGTKLRITSARSGSRRPRVRGGRVTVPFGRPVRLSGRLSLIRGASVRGAQVIATTAVARSGSPDQPLATTTTNGSGRFTLRIPRGPSRVLRLNAPDAGGNTGATGRLSIRVPASSTIRASRRSLSGPGRVTFSGRVRTLGAGLPIRGVVIALQAFDAGRWRTFVDTRTDRRGRWSAFNRFSGRPGTYPVRLRIRRQARFPFVLGVSGTVRVTVR